MLCGRRSGRGDSAVTPVCATQCDGRDSSSVPEAECPRHSTSALHRESRADEGRGPGLGSKLGGCRLIGALKVIIGVDAAPQSEMTGSWMGLCFLPGESSVPSSSLRFRCKPGSFKHEQTRSLPRRGCAEALARRRRRYLGGNSGVSTPFPAEWGAAEPGPARPPADSSVVHVHRTPSLQGQT